VKQRISECDDCVSDNIKEFNNCQNCRTIAVKFLVLLHLVSRFFRQIIYFYLLDLQS